MGGFLSVLPSRFRSTTAPGAGVSEGLVLRRCFLRRGGRDGRKHQTDTTNTTTVRLAAVAKKPDARDIFNFVRPRSV